MPRQYEIFICTLLIACAFACDRKTTNDVSSTASTNTTPSAAAPANGIETIPITNMVLIKAGTFMRGRYRVTLTHDFWLGKYEVTQGEYATLMANNPSNFEGDTNRPVEKVKFPDAEAYCAALTKRESDSGRLQSGQVYRLPTEAEWEYACRASTTNLYSFGDATVADEFAWTLNNSEGTTHPVGQKKPNPWGLYDMHGNVWEWCSDWFAPFPTNNVVDPVGPPSSKFKVFKGGSWNHNLEFARASSRFMMETNGAITFVGLRIALGAPTVPPKKRVVSTENPALSPQPKR